MMMIDRRRSYDKHVFDFGAIEEYQAEVKTMINDQISVLKNEKAELQEDLSDNLDKMNSLEQEMSMAQSQSEIEGYQGRSPSEITNDIDELKADNDKIRSRMGNIDSAIGELERGIEETQTLVDELRERVESTDGNYENIYNELMHSLKDYINKMETIADNVSEYLSKDKKYSAYNEFIDRFKAGSEEMSFITAKEIFTSTLEVFPLLTGTVDEKTINQIVKDLLDAEINDLDINTKTDLIISIYEAYLYYANKLGFDAYFKDKDKNEDELGRHLQASGIDIKEIIRKMVKDALLVAPISNSDEFTKVNPIGDTITFITMVNTGKPFDLKTGGIHFNPYIPIKFSDKAKVDAQDKSMWSRQWEQNMKPDYTGNYSYGYYGMNIFKDQEFLKYGAGIAQYLSDEDFNKFKQSMKEGNYGDNPGDIGMIQEGIDAYLKEKEGK